MIEITLKQYLETVVSKPVYLEIPKDAAKEYYAIERVGGSEDDGVKTSQITIESHGKSLYESAVMDEAIIEAMENATICSEIYGTRLNSHYNATDTERLIYKYKALFDINHY